MKASRQILVAATPQDDPVIPSATHFASAITVIIGFTPLDAGNALASAT
jgi:hypothetical protein